MSGLINKEVIREVTGLCDTEPVLVLKFLNNKDVMEMRRATFNQRALTVNNIRNLAIKYVVMVIGYKIYYTNKENFVFATIIHVAHEMLEK